LNWTWLISSRNMPLRKELPVAWMREASVRSMPGCILIDSTGM